MSDPFIGEIRMFGGNFAPVGFAFCNGQELPISQNDALYALIGTTYGGDGISTFALPDLRGRIPIHKGNGYDLGQKGGQETVTLTAAELPVHTHQVAAVKEPGNSDSPEGAVWATFNQNIYSDNTSNLKSMAQSAIRLAGGGQPHSNMMEYLAVSFIIALEGIFPTEN